MIEHASQEALFSDEKKARQERLAQLCKALAHPVRIQILQYLGSVEACVCGDIVNLLPLAQSTVSQHLKVLKEADLVEGEIDGPRTCYCVNRQALQELKTLVSDL
jgi:ArsR family transcriptional regulator